MEFRVIWSHNYQVTTSVLYCLITNHTKTQWGLKQQSTSLLTNVQSGQDLAGWLLSGVACLGGGGFSFNVAHSCAWHVGSGCQLGAQLWLCPGASTPLHMGPSVTLWDLFIAQQHSYRSNSECPRKQIDMDDIVMISFDVKQLQWPAHVQNEGTQTPPFGYLKNMYIEDNIAIVFKIHNLLQGLKYQVIICRLTLDHPHNPNANQMSLQF